MSFWSIFTGDEQETKSNETTTTTTTTTSDSLERTSSFQGALDEMEERLTDPITFELMVDPVISPCGHTFSDQSISEWLKDHNTCPICNTEIDSMDLKSNYALRDAIQTFESLKQMEEKRQKEEEQQAREESEHDERIVQVQKLQTAILSNTKFSKGLKHTLSGFKIIEFTQQRMDEAAAVLAKAYIDTDKYFYIMGDESGWKEEDRVSVMEWIMERALDYGSSYGRVYLAINTETNDIVGVSIWQSPIRQNLDVFKLIGKGLLAGPFKMGYGASTVRFHQSRTGEMDGRWVNEA